MGRQVIAPRRRPHNLVLQYVPDTKAIWIALMSYNPILR